MRRRQTPQQFALDLDAPAPNTRSVEPHAPRVRPLHPDVQRLLEAAQAIARDLGLPEPR